jgi:ribosomal protein S12 methylthiotransferase accessory factor
MSEIYPVEDLQWENNSVGNDIRPALVRLNDLSDEECRTLLDDLQTMNLGDERPLGKILGLVVPLGTAWKELRIGELKTLLALAIGDVETAREGCDWIHHYRQMNQARWLVYRCVEALLNFDEPANFTHSLTLFYGAETQRQAQALVDRKERFFGLVTLGADFEGSAMHSNLLAAYDKLFASTAEA